MTDPGAFWEDLARDLADPAFARGYVAESELITEVVAAIDAEAAAAPRLIPLPEPARRGLINLADDVIAATNQAVAAAAQLDPSDMTRSIRLDQAASRGHSAESLQIIRPQTPAPRGPRR